MCSTNHDATCTAVLSRSLTRPGQLVATLVCEHCGETLKVLGVYEHHVNPVLVEPAPELQTVTA
jgi:hypothetical protein